ncbi:MAG: Ig-like domain-containing protein [Ferruginibacter sp.]
MRYLNKTIIAFLLIVIAINFVPISINAQSPTLNNDIPGTFKKLPKIQKVKSNSSTIAAVGLQQFYSSTGHYTLSADGIGSTTSSMAIRVNKPNAQATVQKAILLSSVTFTTMANGCVTIGGVPVNWDGTASSAQFNSYWADVTSIVAAQINGFPAGISTLNITECNTGSIEGEGLLVIFNDAAATEKTIIVMVGAQNPLGDNFAVTLSQPIDPNQPGALLDMGLGIGYGYQQNGGGQFSQVSVNGQRLTSSAGGEDDGDHANGALLTVGGIGDVNTNPVDPLAGPTNPRTDDELYTILPFITNTTTSLNINTINPSNDDNIFLAYFALSGAAIIGEGILLSQTTPSANVGTSHTVKASVLNTLGQPIPNRLVTFTISTGPNAGNTFSTNTNASGEAFYTYTGSGGPGTDNIQACFTNSQTLLSCSNTLSVLWTVVNVTDYYSKSSGDLHNVLSWGVNLDGSGTTPPDFGAGKTFHLVNRVPTYTMTASWTVGGKLDIPAGSQLRINGFTLSEADLIGTGSLYGSLTSNLVVTGVAGGNAGALNFASGGNSLNNLTLNRTGASASATVASSVGIYGVLTLTSGTLNTGNFVTLKSNASTTARVAPVTGSVSGNVTVERYIPARRAWRIMSAPVGGTQKINAAWQEGATTFSAISDPNAGFGTHITEGSSAVNGFDHNPLIAMPSVKRYVSASDSWIPLANTNATNVNSDAYLLFVRGHRSTPLGLNTVPATNTVLRATGPLKTGDQLFPVSASGFTAIPNPFASPINFATITKSNVQNNFYLWDPKLGGSTGVGGYVLLSFNGSSYDITPAPVSPESQLIQSGQGFLVHSTGTLGSLTIKESDKSATAATNVFRSANTTKGLRTSLQIVDADRSVSMLDEAFTSYSPVFSNSVDNMDPLKLPNINENLGLKRDGQSLMIERRQEFAGNDTIYLQLSNTTQRKYILQLSPVNLSSSTILSGYVEDKYLQTTTPVSLSEITKVNFTVDGNAASADADRFKVILVGKKMLPVDITSAESAIKLTSNPVSGKTIGIQFINQAAGKYNVTLINNMGQKIYQGTIMHPGGSATQTLHLTNNVVKGVYRMRVTNDKEKGLSAIPVLVN